MGCGEGLTCVHGSIDKVLCGALFGEEEDRDELDEHSGEVEASRVVVRESLFDESPGLLSRAKIKIAAEQSSSGELQGGAVEGRRDSGGREIRGRGEKRKISPSGLPDHGGGSFQRL
jgi:hypothetical protein